MTVGVLMVAHFIACQSKSRLVRPEYRNQKIKNATLLIAPVNSVTFTLSDELKNEFGFNVSEKENFTLFSNSLKQFLKTQSTFDKVTYADYIVEPELEPCILELGGNKKMTINLPKSEQFVKSDSLPEVFVLFLQDVGVSFIKEQKDTSVPVKYYTTTGVTAKDMKLQLQKDFNYYIIHSGTYAILDGKSQKLVSYGKINVKRQYLGLDGFEEAMNKSIIKIVDTILKGTPFS